MLVVEQVLVGVAIGFAMQLTLAAMALPASSSACRWGSASPASTTSRAAFEVPVMSNFFGLIALLLFLALNGHLVLLGVLVKSFTVVPIAADSGITGAGLALAGAGRRALFQMGVWLALPVIAVLLAAHLAVGSCRAWRRNST